MTRVLASLGLIAFAMTEPIAAQDQQPDTESIIIVDGEVVVDAEVPVEESGITVDPQTRTSAEYARQEAERRLEQQALPNLFDKPQVKVTTVEVRSVAVSRPNRQNAEACVQVGVVNAKQDCRQDPK